MENHLNPTLSDYEKSFMVFKNLLTTDYEVEAYPPSFAENKTFGKEFPGALIKKPQYNKCMFLSACFDSADGALSRFHDCLFDNCLFKNCDLRYCDIYNSTFQSKLSQSTILSSNFSFGNFVNSAFKKTSFSGCSFRQMQFERVSFIDCTMENSSIEQTTIKNCMFENMNLRKVGVRYCTFDNTVFKSVIFHILDLAKNYGLIQQLQKSDCPVYVACKNDDLIPLNEAITILWDLIPYYYETKQFYELINVYAAYNEYEKILDVLPYAFECVVSNLDFASLQDLCSLVVRLNICSDKQLRNFYSFIKQLIIPNKFPHYLRKSYNTYIENIKYILVDNPYNNPEAEILLKTNIESLSDNDMAKLLMSVETNIKELAPEVDVSIKLTHHSPYDALIILCGALPEILMICQMFYYCLGGMKSLSDLRGSKKEKISKQPIKSKNQEKSKQIEVSLGKFFTFKYVQEYTERIDALEYTIKS